MSGWTGHAAKQLPERSLLQHLIHNGTADTSRRTTACRQLAISWPAWACVHAPQSAGADATIASRCGKCNPQACCGVDTGRLRTRVIAPVCMCLETCECAGRAICAGVRQVCSDVPCPAFCPGITKTKPNFYSVPSRSLDVASTSTSAHVSAGARKTAPPVLQTLSRPQPLLCLLLNQSPPPPPLPSAA